MPRSKRMGNPPSRDDLLRVRVLDMATYVAEVVSKIKPSKAHSFKLYGATIVPIPIPLKPNQTREQYEARFVDWLFRERNQMKKKLGSKPNVERGSRIAFARAEARAYLLALATQADVKEEPGIKMEEEDEVVWIPAPTSPVRVKRERVVDAEDDNGPLSRKRKTEGDNDPAALPRHQESTDEHRPSGMANDGAFTSEGIAGDAVAAVDEAAYEAIEMEPSTTDSDAPHDVAESNTREAVGLLMPSENQGGGPAARKLVVRTAVAVELL